MAVRKSINLAGFQHKNPIPAACLHGNLLMTGVLTGADPVSGEMPATIEAQCANMFGHVRAVVEAAGGTGESIVKMTVWLRDPSQRDVLNGEWLEMFPDPGSRPARHTMPLTVEGDYLVQCDVTAIVNDSQDTK